MTDWAEWYACPQCPALMGGPCFDLSSGGPRALPPRYREVPHSSRKPRTAVAPDRPPAPEPRPQPPAKAAPVASRRARRTESTADAWRALAEKRRRNA